MLRNEKPMINSMNFFNGANQDQLKFLISKCEKKTKHNPDGTVTNNYILIIKTRQDFINIFTGFLDIGEQPYSVENISISFIEGEEETFEFKPQQIIIPEKYRKDLKDMMSEDSKIMRVKKKRRFN